ncbi:MAG TPA: ABC transporter substrate-binding protein [Steroidobacteraceae bacterium]|nr:ABC transporter substrate-binding protein [Steroidobacteraceae bacterium]
MSAFIATSNRATWRVGVLLASVLLLPVYAHAADTAQLGPAEMVDKVAREVLRELDANRAEMRKDPSKIRALVDKHFLPNFDTEYAASLVLGKTWRTANPDQRKRFVAAFYQSLLQNYGEALLDFTPDRMTIQPYRGDPAATKATVRTEIKRDNGSRVPVNYTLRKTATGWKAYDVTIEGISYVVSFRTDFQSEIDQKGLDSVIQRLETQQAAGKSPLPSKKKS